MATTTDSYKRYLGDGVYAQTDGYHIMLTTENGVSVINTIYLDAQVMEALIKYQHDLHLRLWNSEKTNLK